MRYTSVRLQMQPAWVLPVAVMILKDKCTLLTVLMMLLQIHPWTIWLFWSSPLMYAMQAISVNEFTAGKHLAFRTVLRGWCPVL